LAIARKENSTVKVVVIIDGNSVQVLGCFGDTVGGYAIYSEV